MPKVTDECPNCCERMITNARRPVLMVCCQQRVCRECIFQAAQHYQPTVIDQITCVLCDMDMTCGTLLGALGATCARAIISKRATWRVSEVERKLPLLYTHSARVKHVNEVKQWFDNERLKQMERIAQLNVINSAIIRHQKQIEGDFTCQIDMPDDFKQWVEDYPNTPLSHSTNVSQIRYCPVPECMGVLISSQCSSCNARVCALCEMPQHLDRKCDPADLMSVQTVRSQCKTCPGCSVLVYRFTGCPRMCCTNCHCRFTWDTGRIIARSSDTVHSRPLWTHTEAMQALVDRTDNNDMLIRLHKRMKRTLSQSRRAFKQKMTEHDFLVNIASMAPENVDEFRRKYTVAVLVELIAQDRVLSESHIWTDMLQRLSKEPPATVLQDTCRAIDIHNHNYTTDVPSLSTDQLLSLKL